MATDYEVDPRDPSRPYDSDWVKKGAAELRALKESYARGWTPEIITETEHTVTESNLGQLIVMRSGGVITIPKDLPAGIFGVTGLQNTRTIAATDNLLRVPPTLLSTLYEDYAFAVVMRVAENEWLISGNLMFNVAASSVTPDRTENPVTVLQGEMAVVNTAIVSHGERITDLETVVFPGLPPSP